MSNDPKVWLDLAELDRLRRVSAARITENKENDLHQPTVGKIPRKGPGRRGKLTLDEMRGYQLDLFDIHEDHDEYPDDDHSPGPTHDTNYVRLSCEGVLWALCVLSAVQRAHRYPFDFDARGDVRIERVPIGPAPIVWWKKQPWFVVLNSVYVLCGNYTAAGYQVGTNIRDSSHIALNHCEILMLPAVLKVM